MSTLAASKITAIVWIVINELFAAPYVAYQIYTFYMNRKTQFIVHRNPYLVIPFCVSCLFTVAVVMPFSYGFEIFSGKQVEGSETVSYFCVLYSVMISFIIGIWRAWHVMFDIRHQQEASANTLIGHLDKEKADWFTNNVHTFGNRQWTINRIVVLMLVLTLSFIPFFAIDQFVIIQGIVVATLVLIFVALFVISRNLSAVKDEIMLRSEYIYISCLGTLFGVVYLVIYIFAHDWGVPDPDHVEVQHDTLYLILPSPALYCLILVQTQWVVRQSHRLKEKQRKMEESASKDGKLRVSVALKDVMADYEGYKILMEYLVKCVCSENLMYVSETLQYMKDLTAKHEVTPPNVQSQNYLDAYAIPPDLPQSRIMTQSPATSVRFLKICEKYILEQSEFEINISHKNRKNLTTVYRQLESKVNALKPQHKKLLHMFGDSETRRASQTASSRMMLTSGKERIQRSLSREKSASTPSEQKIKGPVTPSDEAAAHNNAVPAGSKLSFECIQDYQLLADDDVVQNIYDCLCATLGDVYSNLNDAGMRFMQTDVYFRWYDHNKDSLLSHRHSNHDGPHRRHRKEDHDHRDDDDRGHVESDTAVSPSDGGPQ